MGTAFTSADVAAFEHATWSRCALNYEEGFALLTREGVEPVLDAAEVRSGDRVLDLGTGTGVVAAAAQNRGAAVTGVDFSEAMLVQARELVPDVEFRTASTDALPFGDASFDAVVANLVLHHLARPEQSLAEAHRVLRPGGRIACTVWAASETLAAFGLFFAAVGEHAGAAELPHGPLFGVTDEDTLASLFTGAGFAEASVRPVPAVWRMPSVDVLLRAFGSWAQLDTFPSAIRNAIEDSVRAGATEYRTGDVLAIPNPMLLIQANRHG